MTEPEQPISSGADESAPQDDETTLAAGVPGPSGTGEATDAGADPSAPDGS